MASTAAPEVVDLSDPPPEAPETESNGAVDPLSSLTALATALDCYDDDVPAFLNSIIAAHLPPPLPSSQTALPPDLAPIDKQLGELLTRLSLLSQDTSSALEQSIHDISRTVPRLTYDLQFMRESAVSLQSSLHLVQDRVARQARGGGTSEAAEDTEEARTHRSLERLAHLDKLKTRMESARDILAEAESWSTLESEITSYITDKSWTKAGERLAEAGKSLRVFQSAEGEYESKRSLLVSLQNELETALSAALKEAIAKVDTSACASFHEVFRMMDRNNEFQNYYFAARRAPIVDAWSKAVLLDGEGATTPATRTSSEIRSSEELEKLSAFLPRFYEMVLKTLNVERTQIPLIFPAESASTLLATFIETALDDLSPSFHSRLSGVVEYHGAEALPELIKSFKATEGFGLAVQDLMDKLSFNTQDGLLSGSPAGSPGANSPHSPMGRQSRTPSVATHPNRMSISHRLSRSFPVEASHTPSTWETTLYEPFLDHQSAYPAMEKRYLAHLLKADPIFAAESKDRSRVLVDRAIAVFSMGEDAIARCLSFTHGYGALGLIAALNELVHEFLNSSEGFLEHAKAEAGKAAPDELDFDGLDYSTEDWGAFQLGLHVLEASRGIRDRLHAFEAKLLHALESIVPTVNLTPADASTFALRDLGCTLGALSLLQQSPLNSADLHAMTSKLSPPRFKLIRARAAMSDFTRNVQVFLQGIILSPLQAQLDTYPSLAVWTQPDAAPRRGELAVPSFSLSPTDTIARVAEGLLNLLRVFEVYAADDALAYSIETLPYVDVESLREAVAEARDDRKDALDAIAGGPGQSGLGSRPQSRAPSPTTPPIGAEAVLSTWVSSLALSLLAHLTRTTLPRIRQLSTLGAAQLGSDLAYLSNAVRALDVEWDELERWREAAECTDPEEGRGRMGGKVWGMVGRARGW